MVEKIKPYMDIIGITTFGLILRFYYVLRYDFWFDEAFTGLLTKVPYESFLFEVARDPHPALYSYLMRYWSLLFGSSILSLRMFPLLAGVAIVPLGYFLVKKLFNNNVAIFSALLLALNPFLLNYSIEARVYSFYGFLVLLATVLLVYKKFIPFLIVSILVLFSHMLSPLFLLILFVAFIPIFKEDKNFKLYLGILIIFGFLIVYKYLDILVFGSGSLVYTGWIPQTSLNNIFNSGAHYLFGILSKRPGGDQIQEFSFGFSSYILGISVFALVVYESIKKLFEDSSDRFKFLLVSSLWLIPQLLLVLASLFLDTNLYIERYLFPSSIFFILSLSLVLNKIKSFEVKLSLVVIYGLLLFFIKSPDYYSGFDSLNSLYSQAGAPILVFTDPSEFVIGQYYLYGQEIYLYDFKEENPEAWPFINESDIIDANSKVLKDAHIVVSSDRFIDNPDFEEIEEFNSYKIYRKN
jgi:uncharacterized membrane protein